MLPMELKRKLYDTLGVAAMTAESRTLAWATSCTAPLSRRLEVLEHFVVRHRP